MILVFICDEMFERTLFPYNLLNLNCLTLYVFHL